MDNPGEIMRLCRLCLVKDQVNIPIFEEQGDIRQIFLKISSCLPVKVSREDKLPKKICDGCSSKLDLLYEFWTTSANAEKTLLSWLGQAGVKDVEETTNAVVQHIAKPSETQVKEEALEDGHATAQSTENAGLQNASYEEGSSAKDECEEPPPKRVRRTAAVKAQINIAPDSDDDEDDLDNSEPMTKIEDESEESDGEDKDPSYPDVPGTSADDDQPGPSGVGKDGVEAPFITQITPDMTIKGISWQCSNCSKRFPNLGMLQSHMKSQCLKVIREINARKNNRKMKPAKRITSIAENSTFKIKLRTKLSNSKKRSLKLADTKESQKCFWPCLKCPQIFSTEDLLNEHLNNCIVNTEPSKLKKTKTDPKDVCSITLFDAGVRYQFDKFRNVYICSQCSMEFNVKSAIDEHLKKHPVFICKVCEKHFDSIISLGYHSGRHNDSQRMTCPCCTFQFAIKSELAKHIQKEHSEFIHEAPLNFECIVCKKSFFNNIRLWKHQTSRHRVAVESFPCMGAHLEYTSRKSSEPKVYLCDICGKYFNSKYRLERHIKGIHQGLKPFVCRFCGRTFTGKDTMKKHERIHTGEKPYSCEYCGKCFRQHGPFTVHLRIHTGERPYQCKFCKKGFITNQSKKSHMNSCSGRDLEYITLLE